MSRDLGDWSPPKGWESLADQPSRLLEGHRRDAFALDFLEPLVSDRLEIILRSERFCDFVEFGLFYRIYSLGEKSTRLSLAGLWIPLWRPEPKSNHSFFDVR
ncbi:hypothetical protein [Sphingobium nicotianae]|uniref:hypothetical protein n=1 Tax=Sphingobium nicotianae TaxID=2782607 RepID=UPI002032B19C|nr:hypothetical protein [Sphingobium nicotianae]